MCAAALTAAGFATAHAQLIAYDSFNYTAGSNVAGNTLSGVGTWVLANATTTRPTIASGNLTVTGLVASAGQSVSLPGGNYEEALLPFTSTSAGSVYFSIALNLSGLPGSAGYTLGLATGNTNFAATIWTKAATGGYQIGLSNRSNSTAAYDATVYALNTTVLLVGRYNFVAGSANDTSDLWINPSAATFGAGAAPAATLTASGGTDMTAISQFLLRGTSGSPIATLDELRIGTTWASVTPAATPVPEPSTYAVLAGAAALLGVLVQRRRRAAKASVS
jgi:hypothetical protein